MFLCFCFVFVFVFFFLLCTIWKKKLFTKQIIITHGIYYDISGTGRIWLDELDCNGTELSLDECSHGGWGVVDCSHNEDVGIICTNITLSKGNLGKLLFKLKIPAWE